MRGRKGSKRHKDQPLNDNEPPRASVDSYQGDAYRPSVDSYRPSVDGELDFECPPRTSSASNGILTPRTSSASIDIMALFNGSEAQLVENVKPSAEARLQEVNNRCVKKIRALGTEKDELNRQIARLEEDLRINKEVALNFASPLLCPQRATRCHGWVCRNFQSEM